MANNVRYTAAKRREIAAARAAEAEARDRRHAAMTLEGYLADMQAGFERGEHLSNVAAGEDLEWFTGRHAELVARFA